MSEEKQVSLQAVLTLPDNHRTGEAKAHFRNCKDWDNQEVVIDIDGNRKAIRLETSSDLQDGYFFAKQLEQFFACVAGEICHMAETETGYKTSEILDLGSYGGVHRK